MHMKIKTSLYVLVIILLGLPGPSVYAKHLIGTHYGGMTGGILFYSSSDKFYLDGGFTLQGVYNRNVQSNIDARFNLGYTSSDGKRNSIDVEKTILMFGADMVLSLNPGKKIIPYLNIGIRAANIDVSGPGLGNDHRNLGLGVGAGIEYEVTEVLLTRLQLQHHDVGHEDESSLEALGGFWVADSLMFTLSIARNFDSNATSILGGLLFQY
jgi:opacity protein-like surface antigen